MQTLKEKAASFMAAAVDTILPPRCVVSGEVVERQGMVSPEAWSGLDFIVDPFCARCGFPFDFAVDDGSVCTSCLSHPPAFETARGALKYNEVSRDIILGFKHADKTYVVKAFVPWLKRAGAEMLGAADIIIPVPLHHRRIIARRYNQSALIASALSDDTSVPAMLDGLVRTRSTQTQGHLTAKQRFKNVKRAFEVNPKHEKAIKGKAIILIDDVYTTGATVKECTKALIKNGAGAVHVLTLARVVRDEF